LATVVKAILGLAMIVGRLETLALLALILPGRSRS
jgi:Trk-type K+ transport system membrane component